MVNRVERRIKIKVDNLEIEMEEIVCYDSMINNNINKVRYNEDKYNKTVGNIIDIKH